MADPVKNFVKVNVSTGYDDTATSVVLATGHGAKLPDPATLGAFDIVWWNFTDYPDPSDDTNVEIVRVTAKSGDTLTITRAQQSTAATTKNAGGKTYKMILTPTAKTISDILALIANLTAVKIGEAPTGDIDSSNDTFTLSNSPIELALYLNGQRLTVSDDYSISDDTITMSIPPFTGDVLLADYTY